MTPGLGPSVRTVFRQERARDWREAQTPHELVNFAEQVCLYACGGDWVFEPDPLNPACASAFYRTPPPTWEALQHACRRLLFGEQEASVHAKLRRLNELWR